MSRKNLVIGAVAIFVSLTALALFLVASYTTLQAINPIAALTAITVGIIGMAWFKKTKN